MREMKVRIGRYADNDIVINNQFVSGHHAVLDYRPDGRHLLSDANSSNGTFILRQGRAQRLAGPEPVWLEDEILLGNYRVKVSELLSLLPSHFALPSDFNQNAANLDNRTRPVVNPPLIHNMQEREMFPLDRNRAGPPASPEQAALAANYHGKPQQGVARVAMGSPIPGEEQVIWSGYSSLAYWFLGMLWSGLWILVWLILTLLVALPFIILAFIATLGLIRKILLYINTYYEFTSQRVRRREGVFTIRRNQVELFRLKDFEVIETMFGRLFNYSHIRLVSSERIMPRAVLLAVPNGAALAESMRRLAQVNRAESGIMYLKE